MKNLEVIKSGIVAIFLCLCSLNAQATQIIISNLDGAGEGFNDPTAISPAGGNPGTTLGQQRLNVFEQAAKIWEAVVDSSVDIVIDAQFNPLSCTSTQAVLGSAGTTTIHGNFRFTPVRDTWYAAALANSLSGQDKNASTAEITATFNSSIDNNNGCLNGTNWYYGLDGNRPAGTIELLSVVLHEIGHGLGFQTYVDLASGAKFSGQNDIFMLNLEDHSIGQTWDQLTDAGRLASATDTNDLHWTGPDVTAQAANYTSGAGLGHVEMYAPAALSGGSSVSHFSNALTPNELMEPIDTGPKSGPGLALQLMTDIGWSAFPDAVPVIAQLGDQSAMDGETIPVTVLVLDNDTPLSSLSLTAVSSNSAIVAPAGLAFSGSGRQRTLSVTPETGSSGSVTITVTVSDATGSASESFQLNVTLNNSPVVTITSPANNAMFLDTDLVSLQADASDIEDGDVSASLTWSSNISGALGGGSPLAATLVEGTHTITATATDSLGRTGSASLTITSYGNSDTDVDGLPDNWEFSNFGTLAETGSGDFDSDGLLNVDEFVIGTLPTVQDTDGDGLTDGDEVNVYGLDPNVSDKGDIGPRNNPDGLYNAGDVVVMTRLVTGVISPTALELALADINNDNFLNVADLLLLQKAVLVGTTP
ncbi:hypothetical protein DFR30_0867 [Thiogranum longum]|uniref:Dockerin domain-containing protein n=1 Tax=Thiogranum longum TaxID=1537524 RepID=A0A4R1HK69_9GAMM|nr:putative Ig domain-containing protein [Thiogranum longum]TCK17632.1 hypothetical protein DFR30_0867 [Thiogranum longum]